MHITVSLYIVQLYCGVYFQLDRSRRQVVSGLMLQYQLGVAQCFNILCIFSSIKRFKLSGLSAKPKPPVGEADKLPGDDTEGPQLSEDGEPAADPQESEDVDPNDITMSGPHLTTCNSLEQDDSDTASDTDDEEEENEALKLRKDEKVKIIKSKKGYKTE